MPKPLSESSHAAAPKAWKSGDTAILAKVPDRAVPSGLPLFREEASGDLVLSTVIGDAFATLAALIAIVGAGAKLQVFSHARTTRIHQRSPFKIPSTASRNWNISGAVPMVTRR